MIKWRRALAGMLVLCVVPLCCSAVSGVEMKSDSPQATLHESPSDSAPAILHELQMFRQMGSVLYIAAHPDDENTELLAYLARGRDYRTAYLSLTRGDGGQNVLGPDLDAKLGVARTQELLAARKLDGAQQFFSRAVDFGFSKNYQETLNVWNKQEVLSDVVRVIREFRPDLLITRFSPNPGGTHGHHTTSALLAVEAFKLAGDAKAFPEQGLPPWQPKRVMWNVSTFQRDKVVGTDVLKIDTDGKDLVSGESFHEIAEAGRAMHKTQGFDQFRFPSSNNEQKFQLLDGAPATTDIMDGVDTTWNRVPGGAEIGKTTDEIIAKFDRKDPTASVPALLKLRSQLNALPHKDSIIKEKQNLLDHILQQCLGLKVETTIAHSDIVPGEKMQLHSTASIHAKLPSDITVRWVAVRYPLLKKETAKGVDLRINENSSVDSVETLPATTALTEPYWLRMEGSPGMFHVDEPKLIGTPENAPPFPIEEVFQVGGQTLVVHDEPVDVTKDSWGNPVRRRLDIIPPVSLRFLSDVVVMTPGTSRTVEVEVTTSRVHSSGTLQLEAPPDWHVKPAKQPFDLANIGQHEKFSFTITAPNKTETSKITACAEMHGVRYCNQRQEINYPHIPRQLLQPPAVVKAVCLDLAIRGKTVGYLPGAGDSLPENLQQMGYAVKMLDDAKLTDKDLEGLDAVVIGVRAFNVRHNIAAAMPIILSYVENGGTVIVQYNRPDKLKTEKFSPYDLHISPDRVTDEKATMTFLVPDNPVLNTPNKITSADFDGWVQERGLYFPNKWDDHFVPILSCNDPGEGPTKGVLLVAKYGKGYYIYTGLGFFRQLPAGVAGAYRLFANLVSIGK
ncbi:MAG TPA: PIG-L family deacetylase [Trichormus sp.]|jgi:LmbE family N-acetylglucosaminyl deacetylase